MENAPTEAPYKGFEADLAKHELRETQIRAAHGVALPGALRKAFAGEPPSVRIGGADVALEPVRSGLVAFLTRIESPLLPTFQLVLENRDKPAAEVRRLLGETVKATPESLPETVFCFLRKPKVLRAILDQGRIAFREAAMEAVGDQLDPMEMAAAFQAVSEHYAEGFITAIAYEADRQGGDGTVFSQPPAGPMTGSAGGSPTTAR